MRERERCKERESARARERENKRERTTERACAVWKKPMPPVVYIDTHITHTKMHKYDIFVHTYLVIIMYIKKRVLKEIQIMRFKCIRVKIQV